MARASGNRQRETVVVVVGVIVLFSLLILRNGGNYYMRYLHQDTSRAQFEIDQSYVLLFSQAEGFSQSKVEDNEVYNATLVKEFRSKFIGKPTFLQGKNNFQSVKSFQFQFPSAENKALDELLRDKRDGFFIHCCYYDRESLSKASELKITRGWESLIMEVDPKSYEALKAHLRTYSIVNAILSETANFSLNSISKILTEKEQDISKSNDLVDRALDGRESGSNSTIVVPVVPLGFIARTFGRTEIDLLILKANGKELSILKAIILEGCQVLVIKVRFEEIIKQFLVQYGYKMYEFAGWTLKKTSDAIFYSEKAFDTKKTESVLTLLQQLQKAKQIEQ